MGDENEWEWRMVGMENEWEWRMDSPPCEGGVAALSIELIRSFKRRRRGGQFRLALD